MSDLSGIETFLAVVSTGSFVAAARRLSISPAMVGRRVQALEQEHGVMLIERTTRTQRLTPIGEEFVERARRVLQSVEELSALTQLDAEHLSGRIRVSAPTTLGITRLSALIAKFARTNPKLSIQLNLSNRAVDLVGEGFDLAIRIGQLKSSSLIARHAGNYHFVCCASPDYIRLEGQPRSPQELEQFSCVLNLNLTPRNRWPFIGADGAAFSVEVKGGLEIDSDEGLLAAAVAGAGIIYVPQDLVSAHLADGRLIEILSGWDKTVLPIHTLHPSRQFVPRRVSALADAIVAGLRDTRSPRSSTN